MHRRRMMKVFQLFDVETSEPRLLTYSPPPPLHPPEAPGVAGCQHSFDIQMWTQREHLETEILQNSSELGNQY